MSLSSVPPADYRTAYNEYWSRDDRRGESSGDLERTAEQIVASCGTGSVLDIGSGEGALVTALVRRGLDARGLDVSDVVVARCNERLPGRFVHGSVLELPFDSDSFDIVVSTDCLEHVAPEDVPRALAEIRRVARRAIFLKIATTQDRDDHWHLTVQPRAWWEARCFEAGLRKHPSYYRVNDYEALNHDGWQIAILLERVPDAALAKYPLGALDEERGLHMDMLRDTGERSDAHVVRYQWASDFIKPGDRVLDAACGLGYGSHVIANLTGAASVLGVDGSEYAIDYAARSYGDNGGRTRFEKGLLPEALAGHPSGSFDVVVSFETLEHVPDPAALLAEYQRLLTPGGRVIVSVPNDWSDETGKDPNPHHLHVYDWARLKRELAARFIVESAMAQTASQCKLNGGKRWVRMPRSLRPVALLERAPADCEWWLMTGMKSPLAASQPYQERAFANVANDKHPSLDYAGSYRNPWLMHAMVNVTYRLRDGAELERLAHAVMQSAPTNSNDYAAALCVAAYRVLDRSLPAGPETCDVLERVDATIANPPTGAMGLRWKVSLMFVKARLLQTMGRLDEARTAFEACGREDVRPFGIHLSTKCTEAWFRAGGIALGAGDRAGARHCWQQGVEYGNRLQSASLDDILIEPGFPNRFNYGDGVREYALAWDNIARCANGLHLLARGGYVDEVQLQASFQFEHQTFVEALLESRRQNDVLKNDLLEVRRLLEDRTRQLEARADDLVSRTQELVETRATLVERTQLLERASADLIERTADLVSTREELARRTNLLEAGLRDTPDSTQELHSLRALLVERTASLESLQRELDATTSELQAGRRAIIENTGHFLAVQGELDRSQRDLAEARKSLSEREAQLEAASADLRRTAADLAALRESLADRTAQLDRIRNAPFRYALGRILRKIFGPER